MVYKYIYIASLFIHAQDKKNVFFFAALEQEASPIARLI